jgi:SAM-dependent methyltransferase
MREPTSMTDLPERTPHLDRLEQAFRSTSPVFRNIVAKGRAELGPRWAHVLDASVRRLFPGEAELTAAVQGYSRFAMQVLRLQMRFEKERAYVAKSYAEALENVYANDTYMRSEYLPGLLLSHYLWPHHYRQRLFFEHVFVAEMQRAGARSFYDVGVGTGFYSRLALVSVMDLRGIGYDISPSSKSFAEWQARAFGVADRLRVELRDVVDDPPAPTDWLVSVEVLEHLEDPVRFLRGLRAILSEGGKAFVTTALNAPNADHIYLYRNAAEVCAQLDDAGFAVEQYFCALAGKPSFKGAPVAEVAAFVVT